MNRLLFLSLLLFFGEFAFSQESIQEIVSPEIAGPQAAYCGNLVVFETSEPADWCLVPPEKSVGNWSVDTSAKIFYFASSEPGIYTICAAILVDGKPKILSKTFTNGDDPAPQPGPEPNPDDLAAWIRSKSAELSLTKNYSAEKETFAACFQSIASGIDRGTVRSAPAARANLRTCLSPKLLACSNESRKLWSQLFEQLSTEIETRCQSDPNNQQLLRITYGEIATALN